MIRPKRIVKNLLRPHVRRLRFKEHAVEANQQLAQGTGAHEINYFAVLLPKMLTVRHFRENRSALT